jgi:hypothetical protein
MFVFVVLRRASQCSAVNRIMISMNHDFDAVLRLSLFSTKSIRFVKPQRVKSPILVFPHGNDDKTKHALSL